MQEDLGEEACSKGSSDSSEDAIQMILKTAEPLLPGGEKDETRYSPRQLLEKSLQSEDSLQPINI